MIWICACIILYSNILPHTYPPPTYTQMDSVEPMQVDEDGGPYRPDFVVDNPNFDLEAYANSYSGLAKVRRLIFIAKHCPSMRVESLK